MMGWSDGGFGCQTYKQSDLLGCYCYQRLTRALQSLGVWAGVRHISNTEFSLCGKGESLIVASATELRIVQELENAI
jgi:hypothetical protein